eukprot:406752-Amphidinium_carterae.1
MLRPAITTICCLKFVPCISSDFKIQALCNFVVTRSVYSITLIALQLLLAGVTECVPIPTAFTPVQPPTSRTP